jgi:cystathionine beta-lyase/cystathionine gamma-synthase
LFFVLFIPPPLQSSMHRYIILSLVLLQLICGARFAVAQEDGDVDPEKWGELAQLFMSQGFSFGPRHDWNAIDTDEGPFMRAHEAMQSAKQGQDSAVSPGIVQSANFRFPKTLSPQPSSSDTQYVYSRVNNPNFEALERQLGAWYDVRHQTVAKYPNDMLAHLGVDPIAHAGIPSPKVISFASGMGAISAVIGSILKSGDKMIIAKDLYYEVADVGALFSTIGDIKMIEVDVSNIDLVVDEAVDTSVKILYLESASNPHGRIPDFELLINRVRAVNNDIIVVVDNTWTSPVVFQPFRHDVDIIVESATKYLSGKGDAVLGIVAVYNHLPVLSTSASNEDEQDVSELRRSLLASLPQKLRMWRRLIGSNPAPFNAWLVSKGLETLSLRLEHMSIKTPEIADFIQTLPPVTRVHYCGSPSHPHFHLSQKYFYNGYCGGVLSFHLPLQSEEEVELVMRSAAPFIPAPSFGESQTLVMWPRKGNARNFPGDEERGVPDIEGYWFRLSLGLAPTEELKRDFFRWMSRLPFLTKSLASVDHKTFSRNQETGEVLLHISKADWQIIAAEPAPLFLKRQELSDIDANAPKSTHAIPIRMKMVRELGVENVEVAFDTIRPAHLASYVSYDAKYIISSFKHAQTR